MFFRAQRENAMSRPCHIAALRFIAWSHAVRGKLPSRRNSAGSFRRRGVLSRSERRLLSGVNGTVAAPRCDMLECIPLSAARFRCASLPKAKTFAGCAATSERIDSQSIGHRPQDELRMVRSLSRTMRGLFRAFRLKPLVVHGFPRPLSGLVKEALQNGAATAVRCTGSTSAAKPHARDRRLRDAGQFIGATYRNKCGARRYKLFVPAEALGDRLPLVVMMHGCSQTPDDFARATGMNELAARDRFVVAYPEQAAHANRSKCWNWFQPADQQRGRGEPAIIAGLTRYLIKGYDLDRNRVYVAGLSAGAAMAVVLAHNYPELYAALGVHSGLPYAAAHDLSSALAAMRGERISGAKGLTSERETPTIVFHGDRDEIVHPQNAQRLLDQFIHREPLGASIDRRTMTELGGARACTRTVLSDPKGASLCEHWLVHGGGHAWFGGRGHMPHADHRGPDASQEMVRFFLEHRLDQV